MTEPAAPADLAAVVVSARETVGRSAPGARVVGIDLARGVALLSMFVAHTAPGAGPGGVLQISEYLTFPLFALLVGAGAALGARVQGAAQHAVGTLVHAAALLLLGRLLEGAGAHIVIVLAPLGVLTVLAWGIARTPTPVVVAIAGFAAGMAPWTLEASRDTVVRLLVEDSPWSWWFGLVVSPSYPMAVLVTMACLGVLVVRFLVPGHGEDPAPAGAGRSAGRSGVWAVAGATLFVAVVLLALVAADRATIVAYVTTRPEQLLVACLALGVTTLCLGLAGLGTSGPAGRAWRWAVEALAATGRMTLTLYVLQILWLAWWVTDFRPGQNDDTWVNVALLCLGSVAIALVWRALPFPRRWSRGPLEGLLGLVVDLLTVPWRRAGVTGTRTRG